MVVTFRSSNCAALNADIIFCGKIKSHRIGSETALKANVNEHIFNYCYYSKMRLKKKITNPEMPLSFCLKAILS